MSKTKRKFYPGDLVDIAHEPRSHFTTGCRAIVMGSYADQYGRGEHDSFTLFVEGEGRCSWYHANQLTLVERGQWPLLEQWEEKLEADKQQKSDLDWIFANGAEVAEKGYGDSLQALASSMGFGSLWGRNGEGFDWYRNALAVLRVANAFLRDGDKDGWLKFAQTVKGEPKGVLE